MKILKIADIELQASEDYTLKTAEVAKFYGVTSSVIRDHKKLHADELIENQHFIIRKNHLNKPAIYWTLEGVYMLGFFIKSDRAKKYRKAVAKLLKEIKQGNVEVRPKEPKLLPNCEEELEAIIKNSPQYNGLKGLVAKLENELARKQSEIKNLELEIKHLKHQNAQIISQIPKIFAKEISLLERMLDDYYQVMKMEIEHNLKQIKETDEYYQIGLTKIPKITNKGENNEN